MFDFDTVIDRTNTNSLKWDGRQRIFGRPDVVPLWVADMDFKAPPEVLGALRAVLDHGVLGYGEVPESCREAVMAWTERRYGWRIDREWLVFVPGVMPGLNLALRAFTEAGEKVAVQAPVYPPFFRSVEKSARSLVRNPLVLRDGRAAMDIAGLDCGCRAMLFCNPHNPSGRVFERRELEELADLVVRRDLFVFSDEIHADIVYRGARHLPLASISAETAARTVTAIAPSKTFNIAGLKAAVLIVPDPERKKRLEAEVKALLGEDAVSTPGLAALEAAYARGEPWLEALLAYLETNRDMCMDFLAANLPRLRPLRPQGTYLLWMDASDYGLGQRELMDRLIKHGRLGLSDGTAFRPESPGWLRLNFGCPRSTLLEGLDRLRRALGSL